MYRSVDSSGQANRVSADGQTRCCCSETPPNKGHRSIGECDARVIKWTKPGCPAAVEELHVEGTLLPGRVRLRQCRYLNNIVERDHRMVKKRVWLAKDDAVGQTLFIAELFGIAPDRFSNLDRLSTATMLAPANFAMKLLPAKHLHKFLV